MGQIGLLPFLPLAKGGAKREVVKRMFAELEFVENRDLALIGFTLASLVFKRENLPDQDWLIRSFKEMYDLIRDTPIYQEILKQGLEEGLEKGMEKGLKVGRQEKLQELRQAVVDVIQERFPKMMKLTETQTACLDNPVVLRRLIVKMSTVHNMKEAKQYLLSLSQDVKH